jgi:Na+-driven multidrug efflux pump
MHTYLHTHTYMHTYTHTCYSWVGMKTTDTGLVGHTKTIFLEASALSDLWTQSTACVLNGGVYSVFASQAVGAGKYKMAGVWAQVSLYFLSFVCVVVAVLWSLTGPVLRVLGYGEDIVQPAVYYALVLMTALPARLMISQGQLPSS